MPEPTLPSQNLPINIYIGSPAAPSNTEVDPTVPAHVKAITEEDIDNWNNNSIGSEATLRAEADATLQTNIDNEATARENADTDLQTAISNESTARVNADNALQTNITTEATARANADATLQSNLNNLGTAVSNSDNALQTAIDNEAATRLEQDDLLAADILWLKGTAIPYSSVISFANMTSVMAIAEQAANITFTVDAGTKRTGAVTYCRLIGNGTNTVAFTGIRQVRGTGTFDNTAGILNVIQFWYDGANTFVNVWQEANPIPFEFNPARLAPVTWQNLTNTTSVGGTGTVVTTAAVGGANVAALIDATQPFTIYIDYPTGSANSDGIIFVLQSASNTNYAWDGTNTFITGIYHSASVFYATITGGAFISMGQGTATFPRKIRITKNGNDVLYHASVDGGVTWLLYYTHAGRLSGITNMYMKFIVAGTIAGRNITVKKIV